MSVLQCKLTMFHLGGKNVYMSRENLDVVYHSYLCITEGEPVVKINE